MMMNVGSNCEVFFLDETQQRRNSHNMSSIVRAFRGRPRVTLVNILTMPTLALIGPKYV